MDTNSRASCTTEDEKASITIETLTEEVRGHIFQVRYQDFYGAFLDNGAWQPSDQDIESCLEHLKSASVPDECRYKQRKFASLKGAKAEQDIHIPFAKIASEIASYVRSELGEKVDDDWPRAKDPLQPGSAIPRSIPLPNIVPYATRFTTRNSRGAPPGLQPSTSSSRITISNSQGATRSGHGAPSVPRRITRSNNPSAPQRVTRGSHNVPPNDQPAIQSTQNKLSQPQHAPSGEDTTASTALRRAWVAFPRKPTKPKAGEPNYARVMADMALVIKPTDGADTLDLPLGEQPPIHWPETLLVIEAKTDKTFSRDLAAQMASYARQQNAAQPERMFKLQLTVSRDELRVWRWDSAACYISEPIKVHTNVKEFIRLILLFSRMTPVDFGYDSSFSNAGRVLASEVLSMPTTVSIHPTGSNSGEEELYLLPRCIFQAQGVFGRNSVVWEARRVEDGGELGDMGVVKQNWQDVERQSEAEFHEIIGDKTDRITRLRSWQTVANTKDYRARLPDGPMDSLVPEQSQSSSQTFQPPVHRSLIRLAFPDYGKSILESKDSSELVRLCLDIIEGRVFVCTGFLVTPRLITLILTTLELLDANGILHRDISANNILLDANSNALGGRTGFLIDFGLALRSGGADGLAASMAANAHRTGTLPFMAMDLLDFSNTTDIMHGVHHDLESVFWTLFYVCIRETVLATMSSPTSPTHRRAKDALRKLEGTDAPIMRYTKLDILFEPPEFSGKFQDLTSFMEQYAEMCLFGSNKWAKRPSFKRLNFGDVNRLLHECLQGLQSSAMTPPATPIIL